MFASDTQRRSASLDVAFEIKALRDTWLTRNSLPFAWTAWFVHARNLMRFFDGTEDHKDDILARHFFDPPSHWDGIRQRLKPPARYDDYEIAAHKLAAHLTHSRATYRQDGMPPSEEVTEFLLQLARTFISSLPTGDRDWFKDCSTSSVRSPAA
jgi:hypothetical protein